MVKHRVVTLFFVLWVTLASGVGHALSQQEFSEEQLEELMEEWKPLQVTGDALSWDVFAATGALEKCGVDDEGYDYCVMAPEYTQEVLALDGKEVTLMGFMFPLEPSEKQRNFLIGPYPLSCPFHYHIGPSQVIEVLAKEPIAFSYDPVTLKGTFATRFNEETGVFYYLEQALSD